jgi:hypothetical protein
VEAGIVRVRVTVTVGGHGMAGEGMTPELVRALRAAGFEGSTEQWAMTRVTDEEMSADEVAAFAKAGSLRRCPGQDPGGERRAHPRPRRDRVEGIACEREGAEYEQGGGDHEQDPAERPV